LPSPVPPVTTSPGSGLFAVDCKTHRAYVPLDKLDPGTENGRVAVIDLSVDPNTTDPRMAIVVLSHSDISHGTAVDETTGTVIVVSGVGGAGGKLDLIAEAGNTLIAGSPFMFPVGSDSGGFGQVLFDPVDNKAIASALANASCGAGPCTGFTVFDMTAQTFSPVIGANYPEAFAFDVAANAILDASDSDSPSTTIGVVNVTNSVGCTLTDGNLGGDHDGASVDATTHINVVSNEDGTASVINLNGATFSSTTPPCTVIEGGTPPDSVLVTRLPGGTAGSAVNSVTHEAFLIEDGGNGITLMELPPSPVTQIDSTMLSNVQSTIPADPSGAGWATKGDPYAVAIGTCNNKGYAIDSSFTYLVEVDLATFKSSPGPISTALPAGTCAGTSTTFACNNGNGVKFFPLPS
jgi:hypothetical protein